MDGGTWWATVHGVAKSRTQLSDFTFTLSLYTQDAKHGWTQALERASQVVLVAKNPPAKAGDIRDGGSIPGSERCPGGGHGNPLQCSCLENPTDGGAWRATVHGVAKSRTRLKWISTHAHKQLKAWVCKEFGSHCWPDSSEIVAIFENRNPFSKTKGKAWTINTAKFVLTSKSERWFSLLVFSLQHPITDKALLMKIPSKRRISVHVFGSFPCAHLISLNDNKHHIFCVCIAWDCFPFFWHLVLCAYKDAFWTYVCILRYSKLW